MANSKDTQYIKWLEDQSLLYSAGRLAKQVSGKARQWHHPYAKPETESALNTASVWFSAYPAAMITRPKQNILQFLADQELWQAFTDIGIQAIHTGPMKMAGGIVEQQYTPTVDGGFDRITLDVDSKFGSESDYLEMVKAAKKQQALIAGDIIPGHTGKGADFLLALRNYKDYPGIYDLIEIEQHDWHLLPKVDNEWQSVNLDYATIDNLHDKGYIPGRLQRVLFSVPGAKRKETGWDATGEILGVDGKVRRWVYLHYFKPGQPTMNWLDPSHAAEKLIAGDIIKSLHVLQNKIIRLDATPFLGIEARSGSAIAWSEGHPLSITATNNIAALIRKLGGWSFQELNLTIDAIKAFSEHGSELFYDFITRPALQHAMLTKDATFLQFSFRLMNEYNINPRMLIHGMQNHDEITYELVHFMEHAEDDFTYENKVISGKDLRNKIVNEMHELAIGSKTPYNKLSGNGLCTTFVGLIATRLGITDIYDLSQEQKEIIKHGHLLMAMFNAMQPGVFILSGWDLVGALPTPLEKIKHLIADGDYRWINRGPYDLLGVDPNSTDALYGSMIEQLKNPNSFVSQLKHILKIRKQYQIDVAEQIAVPEVKNKGVVIMVHKLPDNLGYQITALNFGDDAILNIVDLNFIKLSNLVGREVIDLLTGEKDSIIEGNRLKIKLRSLEGKVLLIQGDVK